MTNGVLTLRGQTIPSSTVVLDGGVARATAGRTGNFDFGSLPYVPNRCVVKLSATGQPSVLVTVANCDPISLRARGA